MLRDLRELTHRSCALIGCSLFLLCCALAHGARAQSSDMPETLPDDGPASPVEPPPPLRFEASFNAALSVPTRNNPDVAGFGYAITYGVGWGEIPLALGLDFISIGSLGDASSSLDLPLSEGMQAAERKVHTRLLHFEAWLRVQPARTWLRPYAEGFIGAQLAQLRYVVSVGSEPSGVAQAEDWTRSLGWGAGVELMGIWNRFGGLSLTLGVRRVYGTSAAVSQPVVISNERVQTSYTADTSVFMFMLGLGAHYDLGAPAAEADPFDARWSSR